MEGQGRAQLGAAVRAALHSPSSGELMARPIECSIARSERVRGTYGLRQS